MCHERAWSRRGSPVIITTPSTKTKSRTILGVIYVVDVVNVSLREPGYVKRVKVVGARKRKASEDRLFIPKDTTAAHYLKFIDDTLDIVDEFILS